MPRCSDALFLLTGEAVVFEDVLAFSSQATPDENFTQSLAGLDF